MNEIRSRLLARGKDSPLIESKAPSVACSEAGLGSIAVSRQASRSRDTRIGDRHRLTGASISASWNSSTHEAELINLSGGGAMIAAPFTPRLWDRADLHLGENGTVEAAVCWVKEGRIGLVFAHETQIDCSPEMLAQLLHEVIATSFPEAASEPRKEPKAENWRIAQRHPLIWRGIVRRQLDSMQVRLRNVSSTGALVDCERPLPAGAEVKLDLADAGLIPATVSWAISEQAGLRFAEPFDLTSLTRAKPEIAAPHWEQPAYLKDASRASPWANEWKRLSLPELQQQLEGYLKH